MIIIIHCKINDQRTEQNKNDVKIIYLDKVIAESLDALLFPILLKQQPRIFVGLKRSPCLQYTSLNQTVSDRTNLKGLSLYRFP